MSEPEIRIVIPASNEESRISSTIREYCEHFEGRARIVVVANGCQDGTERIVGALQGRYPNLALITINARIGKGGAVRAGFFSGVEVLVGFADADGSTSAREFDRLITRLREFEADGVIGSRWIRGAMMQRPQPALRRIASRIFNGMVRVLFGLPFRDTQCGAKVFRRSAIEKVLPQLEVSNFAFDVDLLYRLRKAGCVVIEMPIAWAEGFEASKVRLLSASGSMLLAIVRLRLRDSLLARIPFFEYIARRSLIPVRESFHLLVLGARRQGDRSVEKYVEELARAWQDSGHTVQWIQTSDIVRRIRVTIWYALFGRHEYDAVLELASGLPYLIPAFSVKPRALLVSDPWDTGRRSARAYGLLYTGVRRIVTNDVSAAADRAREILVEIKRQGLYVALFDYEDGNWSINYTDSTSGIMKRQQL
jgi:hypothetical protein